MYGFKMCGRALQCSSFARSYNAIRRIYIMPVGVIAGVTPLEESKGGEGVERVTYPGERTTAESRPLQGRRLTLDLPAAYGGSLPWEEALRTIARSAATMLQALGASVQVSEGGGALEAASPEVVICLRAGRHASTHVRGLRALTPGRTLWRSRKLADALLERVGERTGMPSRGVPLWTWFPPEIDALGFHQRATSVVLECGCHTCPADELLMGRRAFQVRCAVGITEGILRFLGLSEAEALAVQPMVVEEEATPEALLLVEDPFQAGGSVREEAPIPTDAPVRDGGAILAVASVPADVTPPDEGAFAADGSIPDETAPSEEPISSMEASISEDGQIQDAATPSGEALSSMGAPKSGDGTTLDESPASGEVTSSEEAPTLADVTVTTDATAPESAPKAASTPEAVASPTGRPSREGPSATQEVPPPAPVASPPAPPVQARPNWPPIRPGGNLEPKPRPRAPQGLAVPGRLLPGPNGERPAPMIQTADGSWISPRAFALLKAQQEANRIGAPQAPPPRPENRGEWPSRPSGFIPPPDRSH